MKPSDGRQRILKAKEDYGRPAPKPAALSTMAMYRPDNKYGFFNPNGLSLTIVQATDRPAQFTWEGFGISITSITPLTIGFHIWLNDSYVIRANFYMCDNHMSYKTVEFCLAQIDGYVWGTNATGANEFYDKIMALPLFRGIDKWPSCCAKVDLEHFCDDWPPQVREIFITYSVAHELEATL